MKRLKFPSTMYLFDLKKGILYKKVQDVNPRFISHTRINKITEFYAEMDPFGNVDIKNNITPKAVANPNKFYRYRKIKNENVALYSQAQFYVSNFPNGRHVEMYMKRINDIIERVGKKHPELLIWKMMIQDGKSGLILEL